MANEPLDKNGLLLSESDWVECMDTDGQMQLGKVLEAYPGVDGSAARVKLSIIEESHQAVTRNLKASDVVLVRKAPPC